MKIIICPTSDSCVQAHQLNQYLIRDESLNKGEVKVTAPNRLNMEKGTVLLIVSEKTDHHYIAYAMVESSNYLTAFVRRTNEAGTAWEVERVCRKDNGRNALNSCFLERRQDEAVL